MGHPEGPMGHPVSLCINCQKWGRGIPQTLRINILKLIEGAQQVLHKNLKDNFFFLPHHMACGILVPQPRAEPITPAVEAYSPNPWTTGEIPLKDRCGKEGNYLDCHLQVSVRAVLGQTQ